MLVGADAVLIRRMAAREPEAAAEFFDRYAAEIHRFLLRRAPHSDAEDLLQDVFVRAIRGASAFRFEASVRTWLFTIARHVVIDSHRRWSSTTLDETTDFAPGPESLAASRERTRHAIAALERLPDEQAIVLELHRIEGLSHQEIAELLGIAEATSRKRLQRATHGLATLYESDDSRLPAHSRIESWRASLLRRILGGARPQLGNEGAA